MPLGTLFMSIKPASAHGLILGSTLQLPAQYLDTRSSMLRKGPSHASQTAVMCSGGASGAGVGDVTIIPILLLLLRRRGGG